MNLSCKLHRYNLPAIVIAVLTLMMPPTVARAFDLSTYTANSVLSTGNWVKVSVQSSGIYLISTSQLKSWGFNDPSKVRIYGYGGQRISDRLTIDDYTDDLPPVPCEVTARGLVFYAQGVETWTCSSTSINSTPRWNHSLNPFTVKGYYYLSDADTGLEAPTIKSIGTGGASAPSTVFIDYLYHEDDSYKMGETGHMLVGEDFKWKPTNNFRFNFPDIDNSRQILMTARMVTKTVSSSSFSFTANGAKLAGDLSVMGTSYESSHNIGTAAAKTYEFKLTGENLDLQITHKASGTVTEAHLDYLTFNYTRNLRMNKGLLLFNLNRTGAKLSGATASTRVWDITNPRKVMRLNTSASGDGVAWTNDYTGLRLYAAWDENASLPAPTYEGTVANQNLHGNTELPDMVIIPLPELRAQANRLADLHRNDRDSLTVVVADPQEIYNEFSSGSPDVNSLRHYLKMLYDRGNAAGKPLKYAILMGKPGFDNRVLSSQAKALNYKILPTWQDETSLNDTYSYTTDDIFAFLEDDASSHLNENDLSIAVGRIPARNAADATVAIDKIVEYYNNSRHSIWRNRVMIVADDYNEGQHMYQSEEFEQNLLATPGGDEFLVSKVYIDAFPVANNTMPKARERMFKNLDDGTLWWQYVGHANPTSWTDQGILTYNDINNLFLKNYPILYAATCEFLNWDSASLSGAEIMYLTPGGGSVATISAVRPSWIANNGNLTRAMGAQLAKRDENGNIRTLGEIYRTAKNSLKKDSNKLRYVLMGDPALRLAMPSNHIVIDRINGIDANDTTAVRELKARQIVTIEGHVTNPRGDLLDNFDGALSLDLYDAEYTTVSEGRCSWNNEKKKYNDDGREVPFQETGVKIYSGRDSINGGTFKMRIAMPETISENYRPGAFNMYAISNDGKTEAMGMYRDFYVYGYDDTAIDTIAPSIDEMYLNHPTFVDGGTVNSSPMLIARVSDNSGINLSTSGIGHNINILLDGDRSITDVSEYYTPDMGSLGGVINYPMSNLSPGNHSIRLRVWDNNGNVSERTITCFVNPDAKPELFDMYTDCNPASVEVNFYITHNRPDAKMDVTVEVFNMLGQPVWSSSLSALSEMNTTYPLKWDLTDMAGHRVKRGIYLYRATISESGGEKYVTKTSRLAVTSPQ